MHLTNKHIRCASSGNRLLSILNITPTNFIPFFEMQNGIFLCFVYGLEVLIAHTRSALNPQLWICRAGSNRKRVAFILQTELLLQQPLSFRRKRLSFETSMKFPGFGRRYRNAKWSVSDSLVQRSWKEVTAANYHTISYLYDTSYGKCSAWRHTVLFRRALGWKG